jgi:hypothetical protein
MADDAMSAGMAGLEVAGGADGTVPVDVVPIAVVPHVITDDQRIQFLLVWLLAQWLSMSHLLHRL